MTINKCQGSTFQELGVDLSSDVFSHGQAYVAYSRVRGWSHLHVLLPEGANSAKNVVSREVLDMAFRDSTPRPTSFHPEGRSSHQHWQTEVDAERDAEALADNYDVLQDVTPVNDGHAGHHHLDDDNYIDRDAESEEELMDKAEAEPGHDVMSGVSDGSGAVAQSVPECMAQAKPYTIEGYKIDHKAKYYVVSAGHLTLQPKSYLSIHENNNSWVLEPNSAISAMRVHNIAFNADLQSFNNAHQYPVRWHGKPAEYIRPILAREFLLLSRDQKLRIANHHDGGRSSPGSVKTADQEDVCIAKFAHDVGSVGTLLPTAVFWLISQVCLAATALKGNNMRSAAKWSSFSVCLFEVDSDSVSPGSAQVAVKSNNEMDWTALVHCNDNAQSSVVTLACVLLNDQYYAAEICPKQIAGALMQCSLPYLFFSVLMLQ